MLKYFTLPCKKCYTVVIYEHKDVSCVRYMKKNVTYLCI